MAHVPNTLFALALLALVPACIPQPTAPTPAPQPQPQAPEDPRIAPMPREVTRKPAEAIDGALAYEGRKLVLKLQCVTCHSGTAATKAPNLEGLFGVKVPLKGGVTTAADEAYIAESIRKPKAKVVEGWEPIMPEFDKEKVSEEEMLALVAYIKSLKPGAKSKEERFPAPVGAPK